jgi:cytochrome P450
MGDGEERGMSSYEATTPSAGFADTAADPQPAYRAMREAAAVLPFDGNMVIVCRRGEIEEAFRRPDLFSSNMSAVDLQNVRPMIPLQIDPPDHKKFRKILDPLFAPRRMAELEDPLTRLVNDLMDRFEGRDEIDFAAEFSIPFPSQVFLTRLGLPLDETPRFLAMKDGIIRPEHVTGSVRGSEVAVAHQRASANSIYAYFDDVLDQRQIEGQDDILTTFLHTEVDGHSLTREDILDICFLFLIAGLDTVTASLDCFFAYLARHPEQRRRLAEDPSIIPAAVEELLRWESPVTTVARVAVEDTELGGCPIKAGQHVNVLIGSANTDDAEFGDGDEVRFDRDPNRHLAFGGGIHRCLGSHLARHELRVALREWHRRFPDYSIKPGHALSYTPGVRSIDHFPMLLGMAGRSPTTEL